MTQVPFDSIGAKKPGFWRRQFTPIPTRAQDTFDVIFAVVLPILVLLADPLIFKGGDIFLGRPLLEDYQLLAYLVSTVEMGLFLAWRTFRLPLRPYAAAFAGVFFAAAIFSTVIGIAILPLSLFGLIVVIGILGFTPFLTAFVFLRNGVRAMRIRVTASTMAHRFAVALLSGVLVIALPLFTNMAMETAIDSTVHSMIEGNATEAQLAALRLREFRFVPSKYTGRIAMAYSHESDPVKRSTFNAVYRDITGKDLEVRQRMRYFD